MICTFFGHRDYSGKENEKIKIEIIKLINLGVTQFYVGHNGSFDSEVISILKELKETFEQINFLIVLSRLDSFLMKQYETIFPDEIEEALPKFRIIKRNKWLIDKSDTVISYVRNSFTNGASRFTEEARKERKIIISI